MTKEKKDSKNLESSKENIYCGLIMPLAPMKEYPAGQFNDVQSILIHTIKNITEYSFKPRMVSDSTGEIDIIQNSIVNNIYEDPIVVVDISGRNGNVMLELGLRLAFDKPVVIIKDDKTDYMFDISMIEHLTYPSDLRHTEILKFQELLKEKLVKTYEKSIKDIDYSPFLKNFKRIKVQTIGEETIEQAEALSRIDGKLDMMSKRMQAVDAIERILINEKNNGEIKKIRIKGKDMPIFERYPKDGYFKFNFPDEELNNERDTE